MTYNRVNLSPLPRGWPYYITFIMSPTMIQLKYILQYITDKSHIAHTNVKVMYVKVLLYIYSILVDCVFDPILSKSRLLRCTLSIFLHCCWEKHPQIPRYSNIYSTFSELSEDIRMFPVCMWSIHVLVLLCFVAPAWAYAPSHQYTSSVCACCS